MNRYFFHLMNGAGTVLDDEGRELDSHAAITAAALAEARGILSEDVRTGLLNLHPCIDVRDGRGATVHHLCFVNAINIVQAGPTIPEPPRRGDHPKA